MRRRRGCWGPMRSGRWDSEPDWDPPRSVLETLRLRSGRTEPPPHSTIEHLGLCSRQKRTLPKWAFHFQQRERDPQPRTSASGLLLAGAAEVGHPLIGLHLADPAATVGAVLTTLAVNLQEIPNLQVDPPVHPLADNPRGLSENRVNAVVQVLDFLVTEGGSAPEWIDAGVEEDFVGVGVANSRKEGVGDQDALYLRR